MSCGVVTIHSSVPVEADSLYVLVVSRISNWLRISAVAESLLMVSFKVVCQLVCLVLFFKEQTVRLKSL